MRCYDWPVYAMMWLDALIIAMSCITLLYGLLRAYFGPGILFLLRRSVRARKLLASGLLCLFIAIVAVFFYPLPRTPEFAFRAFWTRVPFVVVEVILMSMFIDSAAMIRRGGRRKTD